MSRATHRLWLTLVPTGADPETGGWQAAGGWRLAAGGWQLAAAAGGQQAAANGTGSPWNNIFSQFQITAC
jgi:hypothetical protein